VLRALTDAVRRGDILYYGFSNAPAWYAAQIATLARDAQGHHRLSLMASEASVTSRTGIVSVAPTFR
jgi:aryl-alcohol dehydrogenase-like predicted oxidoreductase